MRLRPDNLFPATGAYRGAVRANFHGELAQLTIDLTTMCELATSAMERAVSALMLADLALAEQVIDEVDEIGLLGIRCDEHACKLLALQSPVARDLRTVVSGLRAAEKIKRMGELARHVAQVVRRCYPQPAIPADLATRFELMGQEAIAAARATCQAIATPAAGLAAVQDRADDRVDQLHRELLELVQHPHARYSVRDGVNVALLARFLERFADQAVAVTRQLDYVMTAAPPHPAAAPRI
jgi:phosphate transport system protein